MSVPAEEKKLEALSAVILAGGQSARMGRDKALLPLEGRTLIERIHGRLSEVFPRVSVCARGPERFGHPEWTVIPDLLPARCPLAGIHSALSHSETEYTFVAGCDMPWLDARVIRAMAARLPGPDVVAVRTGSGIEPLHAFYSKQCLPLVEARARASRWGIIEFLSLCNALLINASEFSFLSDPDLPFRNVNTEEDYRKILRGPA